MAKKPLTMTQQALLTAVKAAKPVEFTDGSVREADILVSGHTYRTALSLEKRGLVRVRYQGKSLGWVSLPKEKN